MQPYDPPESLYKDREEAGRVLASRLEPYLDRNLILIAIPNGGAHVGVAIAGELDLPLFLIIIRKLQFPDNPEAGFGAVCSNGTLHLNHNLIRHFGLDERIIEQQKEKALRSVRKRQDFYGKWTRLPQMEDKTAVLVDDGLASGFTMEAAVHSVRRSGAKGVMIAVPTSSRSAVRLLESKVDVILCPDISRLPVFAVANAYRDWYDLEDKEVLALLKRNAEQGRP